ncbi:hypothetical protein WN55_09569 [Dufourea novaeangliae]|uniref:Uncharacterized protein n=1 Tax=Dufourea novaeangliae TaxID=178035 RepID=A0A154P0W0_DUFNO|nr:hypothetical protein WN55_09569 [Dufourea novaeangliae]
MGYDNGGQNGQRVGARGQAVYTRLSSTRRAVDRPKRERRWIDGVHGRVVWIEKYANRKE